MRRFHFLRYATSLLLLAPICLQSASGCSSAPATPTGCTKDTDCKGDRVCVDRACVTPQQAENGDNFSEAGDTVTYNDTEAMPKSCTDGAKEYAAVDTPFAPIPLQVWIQTINGAPLLTELEVEDDVAFTNTLFAKSGLSFSIAHIGHFESIEYAESTRARNYVTLMYVEKLDGGDGGIADLGPQPRPWAKVAYKYSHTYSTSVTTAHELGHVLGLEHTHGSAGPKGNDPVEPLNNPDCYTVGPPAGDFLCDTLADPSRKYCQISFQDCKAHCDDEHKDYTPDPRLAMSYYPAGACRTPDSAFSQEQINTMRCVYAEYYKQSFAPASCSSACTGKSCGSLQACACGWCDDESVCVNFACTAGDCSSACASAGKQCGAYQGCDCGTCDSATEICQSGACVECSDLCASAGKTCGPYLGCDCGPCAPDCASTCSGKNCGMYNDCDCGSCDPATQECVNHVCAPKSCGSVCAGAGKNCGTYNSCTCGSCDPIVKECVNNVCSPLPCPEICQNGGKTCGAYQGCNCGSCDPTDEKCQNNTCASCSYSGTETAQDYACQGGIVMDIGGTIDSGGAVKISATKSAGASTFGDGDYYVLVFDPNDGDPSQHCKKFNSEKEHITVSGGPSTITFPSIPSLLVCGGPEKAYCVTKLDANDKAYWCSNKFEVTYQ